MAARPGSPASTPRAAAFCASLQARTAGSLHSSSQRYSSVILTPKYSSVTGRLDVAGIPGAAGGWAAAAPASASRATTSSLVIVSSRGATVEPRSALHRDHTPRPARGRFTILPTLEGGHDGI